MAALEDLVKAVTTLVQVMGVTPFVIVTVMGICFPIGYGIWRDIRQDKKVDDIVREKEKEILRLSEANREYRTALLRIKGFPEKALKADAEDSEQVRKRGKEK